MTRTDARRNGPLMPAVVIAVGAILAVMWAVFVAIDPWRGLDFTDEGLYLLSAHPATRDSTWLWPFGWSTGWLFSLVGDGFGRMRAVSALILAASGAALGASTARFLTTLAGHRRAPEGLTLVIVGAVGAVASLTMYAPFLRVPGYNWVNLTGIQLSGAAVLVLATELRRERPRIWLASAATAVTALGMTFAAPAKPSTPLLFGLAAAVVLLAVARPRRAVLWLAGIVGACLAWAGVALILGAWSTDLASIARRVLAVPVEPEQTLSVATAALARLPVTFASQLVQMPATVAGCAAVGVILLGLAVTLARTRAARARALALGGLVVVGGAAVLATVVWPTDTDWQRSTNANRTTLLVLLALSAAVVHVVNCRTATEGPFTVRSGRDRIGLGAGFALVIFLPFIFGFGSYSGTYALASLAAAPPLVAAAGILRAGPSGRLSTWGVVTVATVAVATTSICLANGRSFPVRQPAIDSQTVPVSLLGTSGSLQLDPGRASTLIDAQAAAVQSGWTAGRTLLDVTWGWHPAVVDVLGARAPLTVGLGLLDSSDASLDRLRYFLRASAPVPADAWVLTSAPDGATDSQRARIADAFALAAQSAGRSAPTDYVCVTRIDGLVTTGVGSGLDGDFESLLLWRPATPDDPASVRGQECARP